MSRTTGTYTAPSSSWNPAVEGTPVDETDWNNLLDDIEAALTESVYTSGLGSTDNRLVRTDGTDTKKTQGSAATLDDSGNLSGIANIALTGYVDVSEMAAPGNPASNVGRLYVADDGGTTKLYFKDAAGTATDLLSPPATIADGDKGDITTSSSGATWTIDDDAVTYAKLQNISATSRIIGRKTSGAGNAEELTASEALDFISATQGAVLYRGASGWAGLGVGSVGQVLRSGGAGADPSWVAVSGTGDVTAASSFGTDNRIVRSDGTAKGVQASAITVDDSGNVSGVVNQTITGYIDVTEIATPSNPSANVARLYAYDYGGTTKVAYRDSAGAETVLGAGSPSAPQGRLTLTTATPIMTSTVSAATTVYYTPYIGQYVPLYDGAAWAMTDVGGELSQTTTDSTKSPAAVTTDSNYDLFVWNDGGTYRCTRGPAWSSGTARGTGAGTTELERIDGIWVNKIAITNGPAAQRGTYVGTIRTNGTSSVDFTAGGSGNDGSPTFVGVWNAYNRVPFHAQSLDSRASHTYATASWRNYGGSSNMRLSMVRGLNEDAVSVQFCGVATSTSNAIAMAVSVGLNGTSPASTTGYTFFNTVSSNIIASSALYSGLPGLGFNYLQGLEYGGTNVTFYGFSAPAQSGMTAQVTY